MKKWFRRLSLMFSAGAAGGLANSIAVWIAGRTGLTAALGVRIAPALTPQWLYPRLVWGGLWGLLFLLPTSKGRPLQRGLILSLGPTLMQLLFFFPERGSGLGGRQLGLLTPLFVLLVNAVWGIVASLWLRTTGEQ